jgi:protein-tyrosine phosphatase
LLLHRLVHVIASDAHSIEGRPPILTPAVKAASKLVGEEEARRMVTEYPRAILDGRDPAVLPPIAF